MDEDVHTKRLIDDEINNDYAHYYTFKRWPAVPDVFLEKHAQIIESNVVKIA